MAETWDEGSVHGRGLDRAQASFPLSFLGPYYRFQRASGNFEIGDLELSRKQLEPKVPIEKERKGTERKVVWTFTCSGRQKGEYDSPL